MASGNRPSLERRDTRKSKKARQDELDMGVSVNVDGTVYTVTQGEMTSQLVMHLRRETGYSFRGLLVAAAKDPDIDVVAALVWLARRQSGELLLSFDEVAEDIGYDSDIDLVEPEADPPEA